jgi:hypothetical protein
MEVPLGEFIVETTKNFPNGPPVPVGTLVHYTFEVFDLTQKKNITGNGTFILGVPEPSSIALLALGAAILPAIAVRRKRSRTDRAA